MQLVGKLQKGIHRRGEVSGQGVGTMHSKSLDIARDHWIETPFEVRVPIALLRQLFDSFPYVVVLHRVVLLPKPTFWL